MTSTLRQEPKRPFATPFTVTGPARQPRQMLDGQQYGGHASVHDAVVADNLGLAGAPIEGPTHFSQFDPLAVAGLGLEWFETGCISAHFSNMVVEGEEVVATLTLTNEASSRIEAVKGDGATVLTGTATVGIDQPTELDARRADRASPGQLFILDQLEVGQRSSSPNPARVDFDSSNGYLYPFSLRQKLAAITEPSEWYLTDANPWGRPVLPFEMISVLAHKSGSEFAVRGPVIGLFLDLEVRLEHGPVFVDQDYLVEHKIIGLSQSRRTESYWVRSTLTDAGSGDVAATVVLHSGVFKASYADYPPDRL